MGFLSAVLEGGRLDAMSDRRALRGAKCVPDIRQGRAAQAPEGRQRRARRQEDEKERARRAPRGESFSQRAPPEILFPSRHVPPVLSIYWRWL